MLGGTFIDNETIYEYNTDTNEATVYYNDELLRNEDLTMEIFGDYLMLTYKSGYEGMFSVINMTDGTKIVDNVRRFSPYLGGDGSYYRDFSTKKWYKLKYPDST